MKTRSPWQRLPGYIGAALMILITAVWTFWGTSEGYHEGWGIAWYTPLLYWIPGAGFLILTLLALRWPRIGGTIVMLAGIAFTLFFMNIHITDGRLVINRNPAGFLISGVVILFGALFLWDGFLKRAHAPDPPAPQWWRRHLLTLLAVGIPLLILLIISANRLPAVLSRIDDGNRNARRIEGNGVSLIWAPEGPGWNWKQPWGGYPSWNSIALYGLSPLGQEEKPGYGKPGYGRQEDGSWIHATAADMAHHNICLYLNEDGLTLNEKPQNIWRMPTVDELVRTLSLHDQNAGCSWDGSKGRMQPCTLAPDKETPLWAPNQSPIYYWAAEEYNTTYGYFVSFNGFVNAEMKSAGNPRHSYRCVREP